MASPRRLGIPKSTVSKRVAELEDGLGARLIQRTSRSFTLTEVGRDFLDHARAVVIEAEAAENVVRRRQAEPSGVVRITTSVPTAQFRLADRLPRLALAHPKVRVELHATDRFVDIVQEGFDIAVRSHFAPLPASGLVQRKLSVDPIILVASPGYLDRRGKPRRPEDLREHDGLLTSALATQWKLRGRTGDTVTVAPRGLLIADESMVLLKAALAGLGVVCLPESFTRADTEAGRLVRVLPAWTAGLVTTTILTPHRRGQLPAVRAVIDFLTADADEAGASSR
ncbi:LysR family transcriptional regulator [Corallococcus macrosporus]|uniref:LysR family transcriptional regulator n=1 Tax=Corallococcus macrosporus DSM 14697 TaxID=1189310 RepID=A0A250JNZ0_9BACT|nr:LysR family transcriptional regulator [Corallococcus macrosporus]ATB45111.1 LysR family transcriptional regulator [Corallococcus macrosporus DSM 14697]